MWEGAPKIGHVVHAFVSISVCMSMWLCADSVWSFMTQTAAQSPCPLWCMRLWLIEHKQGEDFMENLEKLVQMWLMMRRSGEMRWDEISSFQSLKKKKKKKLTTTCIPSNLTWQKKVGKCHHDFHVFDYYSLSGKRKIEHSSTSIRHAHYGVTMTVSQHFRGVPVVHALGAISAAGQVIIKNSETLCALCNKRSHLSQGPFSSESGRFSPETVWYFAAQPSSRQSSQCPSSGCSTAVWTKLTSVRFSPRCVACDTKALQKLWFQDKIRPVALKLLGWRWHNDFSLTDLYQYDKERWDENFFFFFFFFLTSISTSESFV